MAGSWQPRRYSIATRALIGELFFAVALWQGWHSMPTPLFLVFLVAGLAGLSVLVEAQQVAAPPGNASR